MNLQSLRTLVRVAERGSFTAVARASNMTLSAVSAQMKGLERELDAVLFDRRVRPPRLTPLGRTVADHAARVLAAQAAMAEACAEGDALAGHHRLGLIQSAYVRLLPRFIALTAHEAPRATFAFALGTSRDLEARVAAGALDAAVLTAGEPAGKMAPALATRVLREEPMGFALPLADVTGPLAEVGGPLADMDGLLADAEGPDAAAAALERAHAARTFFHFTPSTGIGALVADHLRREGIAPRKVVVLDSLEAAVACTAAGVGYTLLPVSDLRRYGAGRIAVARLDTPRMVRRLACVAPPGGTGERLAAMFAACLD